MSKCVFSTISGKQFWVLNLVESNGSRAIVSSSVTFDSYIQIFFMIDEMIMVMQWHFLMDDEKLNFHNINVILIAFKWFEDIMTNTYIHF